jgi:hypothetical protein
MAWSERMWPDAGPEVPDQRPAAGAQDAADLGQAGRWVGPVVHRQGADDQVERLAGEGQGGHVADQKRWPALVAVPRTVGVGSGTGDHGRVQVEAGHGEPVVAGQPERQVAGSAPDLEDLGAGGGDRRDVGRDAFDERAEQEPAQGVVDAGIANEDASRWPRAARRPCRRTATAAAAAPAKIAKFRGRIIKPPLGSPELWLGQGIPSPGGLHPG